MDADSFHRVAKVLADSGEVATIEDAEAALATYGVRVVLDPSVEDSPSLQIIALTAINTASRSFLGNVRIVFRFDKKHAGLRLRSRSAGAG